MTSWAISSAFKGPIVIRSAREEDGAGIFPAAPSRSTCVAAGRKLQLKKPNIGPHDIAFLQYTGGTTGVSKGAVLLHRNIVANTLQNEAWLQPALKKPPHVDRMIIVTALPLYHIFALTVCALLGMRIGAMCVLIPNPRDIPGSPRTAKYNSTWRR